jgi:hypothetical protein
MVYPRKNTGASCNGFGRANRIGGTNRSMPTRPRAGSIFSLTKPKGNQQRAYFASGRLKSEIRRHLAILEALPDAAT